MSVGFFFTVCLSLYTEEMVSVTAITPQHITGRTEIQHWLAWLFCSVSRKWTFSLGIWYAYNLWVWLQMISLTIGMPGSSLKLISLQCRYPAKFCSLVEEASLLRAGAILETFMTSLGLSCFTLLSWIPSAQGSFHPWDGWCFSEMEGTVTQLYFPCAPHFWESRDPSLQPRVDNSN